MKARAAEIKAATIDSGGGRALVIKSHTPCDTSCAEGALAAWATPP
jgi:hypothetical protein